MRALLSSFGTKLERFLMAKQWRPVVLPVRLHQRYNIMGLLLSTRYESGGKASSRLFEISDIAQSIPRKARFFVIQLLWFASKE